MDSEENVGASEGRGLFYISVHEMMTKNMGFENIINLEYI